MPSRQNYFFVAKKVAKKSGYVASPYRCPKWETTFCGQKVAKREVMWLCLIVIKTSNGCLFYFLQNDFHLIYGSKHN